MGSIFGLPSWVMSRMIDEYPTFQDLVMALGEDGAENSVLEHVYHGEVV